MSMQIYKNGALLYDPIDNTGSSDHAAMGARTTLGTLNYMTVEVFRLNNK